jgi:hypothetical protein
MFCFNEKSDAMDRSTNILEVLCSLLNECDKFLQVLRSSPNITVQDLAQFILVVLKNVQVICSVSPSMTYVKSTSENVFVESIEVKLQVTYITAVVILIILYFRRKSVSFSILNKSMHDKN